MNFTYKNTVKDVFWFQLRAIFRFPAIIFAIFIPFLITKYAIESDDFQISIAMIITAVIFYTLSFLVYYILQMILLFAFTVANYSINKSKNIICEHKLTMTDEYIIDQTEYSEAKYKKNGIREIKEKKHYFLIYVSKSSAILIPKRYLNMDEINFTKQYSTQFNKNITKP